MPMSARENFVRTLEFRNPEWIPTPFAISPGWVSAGATTVVVLVVGPYLISGSAEEKPSSAAK